MTEHHPEHHVEHQEHLYHDPELKKYMRIVARSNKVAYVVFRALLTGVFTAVGTTIGFALLIFLAAALVSNLKHVPVLDSILQETKLDVLIEDQLARIQKGTTTENTDNVVEETYTDSTYKLSFRYPSTFNSIKQVSADPTGKVIQMTGNGPLHTLEIYINKPAVVSGDSTQANVVPEDLTPLTVNVYEDGAKVNDVEYTNAVFQTKFQQGDNEYVVLGFADNSRPKLAREVYITVLQSLGFNK